MDEIDRSGYLVNLNRVPDIGFRVEHNGKRSKYDLTVIATRGYTNEEGQLKTLVLWLRSKDGKEVVSGLRSKAPGMAHQSIAAWIKGEIEGDAPPKLIGPIKDPMRGWRVMSDEEIEAELIRKATEGR